MSKGEMENPTERPEETEEQKYGVIPEDEFVVYGIVYAHPEHADALEALYAKMTELAQTEPGVIHYCLARRTDDPMAFHFFERYESKAAFEEHVSREETQKILGSGWVRDTVARFERPIKPPACL